MYRIFSLVITHEDKKRISSGGKNEDAGGKNGFIWGGLRVRLSPLITLMLVCVCGRYQLVKDHVYVHVLIFKNKNYKSVGSLVRFRKPYLFT